MFPELQASMTSIWYTGGAPSANLFKVDYWQFTQKSAAHDLIAINAYTDKYKIDTASGTNTAAMNVKAIYADGTSEDVTTQLLQPRRKAVLSMSRAGL
ncbi:hypothetical protein L0M14_16285 [Paenibacillus hexagrammi]|uniref:Uncharacterized protein n=1 Tax=Paenibacillus hexagrammi TaxID=2908839 RepID=A0ABY3SE49_9BACL|nr:hypothetical protein L0M14_16285 [Paenibacillus sp. YPD9-1]